MKKLNNKGLTLVELIVSFALVSVAMLYFYQTVSTVSKLYKKAKDEENLFSESTYTLRLLNSYCKKERTDCNSKDNIDNFLTRINSKLSVKTFNSNSSINNMNYNMITLEDKNGNEYVLYSKKATLVVKTVTINDTENVDVKCYDNEPCDILSQITDNRTTSSNYIITVDEGAKKLKYYSTSETTYSYNNNPLNNNYIFKKNDANIKNETIKLNSTINYKDAINYTGYYEAFKDGNGWKVKFLTSGNLTLAKDLNSIKIDAFLVGGGGSGGDSPKTLSYYGASGGGGASATPTSVERSGGYGGSGIVIIRNAR